MTCCVPLLKGYFQGDDYYMDRLHRDGVVPGFFYYPLDGVDRKEILNLGLSILPVNVNPMLIFSPPIRFRLPL